MQNGRGGQFDPRALFVRGPISLVSAHHIRAGVFETSEQLP